VTIERARRFARAYLDEFGPQGEFEMSMPNELELEMVAAVFVKELDCTVQYNKGNDSITLQMPWFKYSVAVSSAMHAAETSAGYIS